MSSPIPDNQPADEAAGSKTIVRTFGHGTLAMEDFARILHRAGVERVVDVRSFPGSRRNPQFGREAMEEWLPRAGLDYSWINKLGGRRRPNRHSRHILLRHEAFRAYADYMESEDFAEGIAELLELARGQRCAVMCSESVWWRCHRRLLADHLILVEGLVVLDLMHDGRENPHIPTEGVRNDNGVLVYDQHPAAVPEAQLF